MAYRVVLLSTVTMALLSFLVSNVKLLVTYGGRNRVAVMALSSSVQGLWSHHRCTTTTQKHALSFHKFLSTKSSSSSFMTQLFMSSSDDENVEEEEDITIQERTSFNIPILKKETQRLTLRTHKKIGKVSTRIRGVEQQYETLRLAIDNAKEGDEEEEKLLQQLEHAPDINIHKAELHELQSRLKKLNYLEEQYTKLPLLKKSKQLSISNVSNLDKDHEIHTVIKYIIELDISDDESQKQKKIEQDAKNRRAKAMKKKEMDGSNDQGGPRLPYRRYYSEQKTEIRVSIYIYCLYSTAQLPE